MSTCVLCLAPVLDGEPVVFEVRGAIHQWCADDEGWVAEHEARAGRPRTDPVPITASDLTRGHLGAFLTLDPGASIGGAWSGAKEVLAISHDDYVVTVQLYPGDTPWFLPPATVVWVEFTREEATCPR